MILIDKMKNLKIYRTQTFLPQLKEDKKKHSAVILMTPNYESSKKLMNHNLFVNKKRYESYYLDRDVSFYIAVSSRHGFRTRAGSLLQRLVFPDYSL
jgi:hypothetical protein